MIELKILTLTNLHLEKSLVSLNKSRFSNRMRCSTFFKLPFDSLKIKVIINVKNILFENFILT